ncbi:glycoside hydrolase superfamily [Mucidula mucida]|nr:glycoside hydrolase superfamily [Mucidula mucida]
MISGKCSDVLIMINASKGSVSSISRSRPPRPGGFSSQRLTPGFYGRPPCTSDRTSYKMTSASSLSHHLKFPQGNSGSNLRLTRAAVMRSFSSFVSLAILLSCATARPCTQYVYPSESYSVAESTSSMPSSFQSLSTSSVATQGQRPHPPPSTLSTTSPSTSTAPVTCSGDLTKFTYFGVNEAGAEFGNTNIPGTLGTDYIFPEERCAFGYFVDLGFNFFRVPFLMERLVSPATGITGELDEDYFGLLNDTVNYITSKGASVAIEPHNFMIYDGSTLSSASEYVALWTNLANEYVSNPNVIFDLMNEPHDIAATTVAEMMQAGIDGVRSTGATQLILVEGTSWTTSGNSDAFATITDTLDNTAIEMHQYLDSDGSGTSETCVSSTIGAERIADATAWLQETGFKGFLGEIGAGSNDDCIAAVYGTMCAMQQAGGSWIGAAYWAAGPWWGDYFQSIEPPSGASVSEMLPQALEPFL